jgi:hypothetical protein
MSQKNECQERKGEAEELKGINAAAFGKRHTRNGRSWTRTRRPHEEVE